MNSPVVDAAELLFLGLCSAKCLLAMETPCGYVGCTCTCDGKYHAALCLAPVVPIAQIVAADGEFLGWRPGVDREAVSA